MVCLYNHVRKGIPLEGDTQILKLWVSFEFAYEFYSTGSFVGTTEYCCTVPEGLSAPYNEKCKYLWSAKEVLGKVIFSQVFVYPWRGGASASRVGGWTDLPPPRRYMGYYGQQASSMHPTGMHSCYIFSAIHNSNANGAVSGHTPP